MSNRLEAWVDEIYELLDEGVELGDIEVVVRCTCEAIREERGLDD